MLYLIFRLSRIFREFCEYAEPIILVWSVRFPFQFRIEFHLYQSFSVPFDRLFTFSFFSVRFFVVQENLESRFYSRSTRIRESRGKNGGVHFSWLRTSFSTQPFTPGVPCKLNLWADRSSLQIARGETADVGDRSIDRSFVRHNVNVRFHAQI